MKSAKPPGLSPDAPIPEGAPALTADAAQGIEQGAELPPPDARTTARLPAPPVLSGDASELIGLVSHELRTPLNAMVGWLHVLETTPEAASDIASKARAGIARAVEQQRELVDLLIDSDRAGRRLLVLDRTPTAASALMVSLEQELRPLVEAGRKHWETVPPLADFELNVDRGRVQLALQALVAAITRHAAPGSSVTLGMSAFRGEGILSVRESLNGADATATERVFGSWLHQRTLSGVTAIKPSFRLTVARQILELHGGWLELSEPAELRIGLGPILRPLA